MFVRSVPFVTWTIFAIWAACLSGQTLRREYIRSNGKSIAVVNLGPRANKIAAFRDGIWTVDTNRSLAFESGVDQVFTFGQPGDRAISGDWTGLGRRSLGVFRPADTGWTLDMNGNNAVDAGDRITYFGLMYDSPVVGDWTGDGKHKIGVFRDGYWFVDLNGNGWWDGLGVDGVFGFGLSGDDPITGDWTNTGLDSIGIYRNGTWCLDVDGDRMWNGAIDFAFVYGAAGQKPIVGDWSGTGAIRIGTFVDGGWYLDWNGDRVFTPPPVDKAFIFGTGGDQGVVVGP